MATNKELILEAAHTHTIYSMLVPQGRLLKWADVMCTAADALNATDPKMRAHMEYLFHAEIQKLLYEPMLTLVNAVQINLPNETKSKEVEEHRQKLGKIVIEVKEKAKEEKPNFVELKYALIDGLNVCFEYLNSVQDFEYPELKNMNEMMPEALL